MERKSRRNYPHVWTKVAEKETNKFYHQDEIDKQLKEKLCLQGMQSVGEFAVILNWIFQSSVLMNMMVRGTRSLYRRKCIRIY